MSTYPATNTRLEKVVVVTSGQTLRQTCAYVLYTYKLFMYICMNICVVQGGEDAQDAVCL